RAGRLVAYETAPRIVESSSPFRELGRDILQGGIAALDGLSQILQLSELLARRAGICLRSSFRGQGCRRRHRGLIGRRAVHFVACRLGRALTRLRSRRRGSLLGVFGLGHIAFSLWQ